MKKAIVTVLLTTVMLTGCSSEVTSESNYITQAEYDKIIQERDEYKKKYETLLATTTVPTDDTSTNSDSQPTESSAQEPTTEALSENIKTENESFDHYDCFLNPSVDEYNGPVHSKLKSKVNETDNKLIFSITNTGDTDAQFVRCDVLFLLDGKVVGHGYAYAGTSNGEIAASKTERAEISKPYNTSYDKYILFLDGQASGTW